MLSERPYKVMQRRYLNNVCKQEKYLTPYMRSCFLLLLRNVWKHISMTFQATRLYFFFSDKFWNCQKDAKLQICCKCLFFFFLFFFVVVFLVVVFFFFVKSRLHNRPTERMSVGQHLFAWEAKITETDTSFMVYEIRVTFQKLINQYTQFVFFFQTPYLHKMVCFLYSLKEIVKTIVKRDA